jgi:hypothetical protein
MNDAPQLGFQTVHRAALLLLSVLLLAFVLELVRRGRFKERYALLWLAAAGASLAIGLFPVLIEKLALVMRVQYLTVVYGVSFLFLLGIVLGFSVVISRLSERCRELAQEIALLAHRVHRMESQDRDEE